MGGYCDSKTMPRRPLRLVPVLALLACAAAQAQTDAERIADLERRLERSLQLIDSLTKRVQQLEAAGTTAAAPAPPPAAPATAPAVTAPAGDFGRGLALHGFADVGAVGGSPQRPAGGRVGSLDLYLTPQFGERAKGLVELVFEVDGGELEIDLERLQLGWTFADALTLWAGRFHTPFGYWNTAFHHGAQIQTSITRPRFLDFEDVGGVLPVHTVGAWAMGSVRLAAGRLSYDLYVGNAPTIELQTGPGSGMLDPNVGGSREHDATFGGSLSYSFVNSLDGLTIGAHALRSKVADNAPQPNRTRLQFAGGWFAYDRSNWELLGELYRFRNSDLAGATGRHRSRAHYLQLGRSFGDWTPFARIERTSFDASDRYFAQQENGASYARDVLGVRYNLTPTMALKLEGNRTRFDDRGRPDFSEVRVQIAVRFGR